MRNWVIRATLLVLGLLCAPTAFAQTLEGFQLNRFEPTPAGDRFFAVQGADPGGQAQVRAILLGNYAYRPLVLYRNDGDDRVGNIVSDQLLLHGGLALGLFDRLVLSVDVPIAVLTEGDSPSSGGLSVASPDGAAFGDVRAGARLRLLGQARDVFSLGIAGYVWIPSGDEDKLTSDGAVRGMPALVVSGETGAFAYAVNAGAVFRSERRFAGSTLNDELTFGAAAGVLLAERRLQIGPEVYGSTRAAELFERDTTQLEGLLGARFRVSPIVMGVAAGPGFSDGLGTPSLRVVASVAYAPEHTPPSDRDRDGVLDEKDACPTVAGSPSRIESRNGCPPDSDDDGVLDENDACPIVPGVAHQDPKHNGCPPDRDGDGVYDSEDRCPDVAGQASADRRKNGCPGDRDGDRVRDDQDACPDEPGVRDADPQKNGCPKPAAQSLVRVTDKELVILQQVQFETASDVILPQSDELLTQVANVLREHPEITKLEVQGHTDNRGAKAFNQKLSQRRAASVVSWLTSKGQIDATRLVAKGYGADRPLTGNETEEGRAQNRRVQFLIIENTRRAGDQKEETK